jgi:hypothetical protein
VRFELTRPRGLPVFKTGAINHSATPPSGKRVREEFAIAANLSKHETTVAALCGASVLQGRYSAGKPEPPAPPLLQPLNLIPARVRNRG